MPHTTDTMYPLYIEIRNLKSFGNKLIHIDLPGPGESMLIHGKVGSGKSAILDGLIYNLTGKKIGSRTIINTVNKKNLYTKVAWHVPGRPEPVVIERGQKPALFKVKGLKGTLQKEKMMELAQLVPITDPQLLLNLCVLSASKSLPFFNLKKQQRLEFLRNFVDATELDARAEDAKNLNLQATRDINI